MKFPITSSLVLLSSPLLAQGLRPTTKFENRQREFRLYRQYNLIEPTSTTLYTLENHSNAPASYWFDEAMYNRTDPMLTQLKNAPITGFGYTSHTGIHGYRFQVGVTGRNFESGSTSGFRYRTTPIPG